MIKNLLVMESSQTFEVQPTPNWRKFPVFGRGWELCT